MRNLTEDGRRLVRDLAARHGVSEEAVEALLAALVAGRGSQAQFDHPELGGMGQWSAGGMVMIGEMFNDALKRKVDALASELALALREGGVLADTNSASAGEIRSSGDAWPAELGAPASAGSQNGARYAFFPETRRLAIERGGQMKVYDTGDHLISGVSQQQGGAQSLVFTSQLGAIRLDDLKVVPASGRGAHPSASPSGGQSRMPTSDDDDVFTKIERLHALRMKDIITEQEFAAKKAELLGRI